MLRLLSLCLLLLTGACAEVIRSDPTDIAAARYQSEAPSYVSLVTMVSKRNGRGAHTALIINGSERVIWDPAGTFTHPEMPENEDLHFGATDRMVDYYKRYHARFSHFVHEQRVYVDPATAETVLRRAMVQGATPKAFCTRATGNILRGSPTFAGAPDTFYPEKMRAWFATLPGVEDSYVNENDLEKAFPTY